MKGREHVLWRAFALCQAGSYSARELHPSYTIDIHIYSQPCTILTAGTNHRYNAPPLPPFSLLSSLSPPLPPSCPQMPVLIASTIASEKPTDGYLVKDIISILSELLLTVPHSTQAMCLNSRSACLQMCDVERERSGLSNLIYSDYVLRTVEFLIEYVLL